MKNIVAICLLILASPAVDARIGESPSECEKLYQDPTEGVAPYGNHYFKGALATTCRFEGGKCVAAMYGFGGGSVVTRDVTRPKFTREQCMKLLDLNAPGVKWVKVSGEDATEDFDATYQTEDGKIQAKITTRGVNVELTSYPKQQDANLQPAAFDAVIEGLGK